MPDTTPTTRRDETAGSTDPTEVFAGHRELLFAVVYDMLGSVSDTEDVLQETWLSWESRYRSPDGGPIEHPRAYLVRIAVHQALARQAVVARRRETYVGPWLPEPLVTGLPDNGGEGDVAGAAVRSDLLSMAVLVVLETLSPLERTTFVLHEVFGYAHTEIADILGRSPSAVRQLAHRAREHVHARRPRYPVDRRLQRQVTERFVAAAAGGDVDALLRVLAPDVTLWADGGGKVRRAAQRPIQGRDNVARFLLGVSSGPQPALEVRYRQVNGDPSVLLLADGVPVTVLVLDLAPGGEQVAGVYAVGNPDKLARVDTGPDAGTDAGGRA